ncbi:MAG: hypothetical protein LBO75_04420, partial [Bifidobacteriaceae bacterium]|nr:hypothetical protein [Bifidobacteriaceae bacterium]
GIQTGVKVNSTLTVVAAGTSVAPSTSTSTAAAMQNPKGTLPFTGWSGLALVVLALGLFALGSGLVAWRRRSGSYAVGSDSTEMLI